MKIKEKYHLIIRKIRFKIRQRLLKNKDFTIISNNCFGGGVYQYFDLPYKSPTIGLYFFAKDYIKFLKKLDYYLNLELNFIDPKNSKHFEELPEESKKVPIGVLGDIEIIFLHYNSEEEARLKWERRKKRISRERLIVKFNDQNGATEKEIKEFFKLNYKNKLCFTAKSIKEIPELIVFDEYSNEKYIKDDYSKWKKYINIIKYINRLK